MSKEFETENVPYGIVGIGVPGVPWPTRVEREEVVAGKNVSKMVFETIETIEASLALHTGRPQKEVWGEFFRNMPVPSHLSKFEALIKMSDPAKKKRLAHFRSDPGEGKSFLGVLFGTGRDKRGPIITNVAQKNLETLLWETVFDTQESAPLTDAIDKGLAEGSLDKISLSVLERSFGTHYSEKNGKHCIDWTGLVADKEISPDAIKQALELVRSNQRWDAKSLGIEFKTRPGPLVLADKYDRDIVIDEFSDCKPGTDKTLNPILQVFNGEIPEYTIKLGSNGDYTFTSKGKNRIAVFTSNRPKDGEGTGNLSEAVASRATPQDLPNFTELDWQHRFCQRVSGMPISTLYLIQPGKWVKDASNNDTWEISNPAAFGKLLHRYHDAGLNDEQLHSPEHQRQSLYLDHWQDTLEAAAAYAKAYLQHAQLTEPESDMLKGSSMGPVLQEVEDPNTPVNKITPRAMLDNITDAEMQRPSSISIDESAGYNPDLDWDKPIDITRRKQQPPTASFGDNLYDMMRADVRLYRDVLNKPKLADQWEKIIKECGLREASNKLNVVPPLRASGNHEVDEMREQLCAYLRREYPEMAMDDIEEAIPAAEVQNLLLSLTGERQPLSPVDTQLMAPSDASQSLISPVVVSSPLKGESSESITARFSPERLLGRDALLTSLILPQIKESNIKALWNKSFATKNQEELPEITKMAANCSETGIGLTSVLCCLPSGAREKLHIVRSTDPEKILIVGTENIAPDLKNRLREGKIQYVSLQQGKAKDEIKALLNDMIPAPKRDTALQAFLFRNTLTDAGKSLNKPDLADLLTTPAASKLIIASAVTNLSTNAARGIGSWAEAVKQWPSEAETGVQR